MAAKHLQQRKAFNRSSLVSDGVEFCARKLIYFVLLQLVLSSFVLITANTLNGSPNNNNSSSSSNNNNNNAASSFELPKLTPFGCATNTITDRTKCTGGDGVGGSSSSGSNDGVLKTELAFNETDGKTTKENLILWHGDGGGDDDGDGDAKASERPLRDDDNNNLSLTGNASIRNQSRQTITSSNSNSMKNRHRREPSTDGGFNKDGSERVLSRKRRYLIFPPGSSLQIVYDTYHPIVDHSNLLVLGITAAMAWELPSKPVDINEYLHGTSYEMEELRRKDKNVTNASPQYALPSKSDSDNTINRIDSNGYYTNIPKQKIFYEKPNQYQSPYKSYGKYKNKSPLPSSSNKLQDYVMYADSLMKQFKRLTETIPPNRPFSPVNFQEFANVLAKNVKTQRYQNHRIRGNSYNRIVHPVFKKRSIDKMTPLEKFDLNLHRNSRHALYKQINMFLKTQGSDGNECILKMLCETGQRRNDRAPESMVIELLRTVFTLPEPLEPADKIEHRMYDEAHETIDNCQKLYPKCIESVWNSKYM